MSTPKILYRLENMKNLFKSTRQCDLYEQVGKKMTFMRKILDMLNMENETTKNNNIEEIIGNEIAAFFKNGKLYKLSPSDTENWYDAKYIVSDGIIYDLGYAEDIKKIPIPQFKRLEGDNYGVTGMLDYVLRMKSRYLYQRKEKELCSACLWKTTEMMFANPLCKWSKKDYERILKYHLLLGMDEEAERAKKYLESKGIIFIDHELQEMKPKTKKKSEASQRKKSAPKEKIDWREKELITVQNITTDDMQELDMPFMCNTEVKKYIHEGNHPFAYMEISGENVRIVKSEIKKMNAIIKESIRDYPNIPQNLSIPASSLVFQSPNYGYTRIMCTPKTYEGNKSKYPYTLYFCTDLSKRGNTTHGELTYGQNGDIQKAVVVFWRNNNQFVLNFKRADGKLTFTDMGQSKPTW